MSILAMLCRPLFATILIGVALESNVCVVKVVKKRVGSVVEEDSKEFKILNGELSAEAIKFIRKLKSRYAFSYVAILSKSKEQILAPGNKKANLPNFGIEERECKIVKLKNLAFISMPKEETLQYQKEFKPAMGLDFLFSPFVLLFFKSKTFLGDIPKMFVLQEKEYLTAFIASRKSVLYGKFFSMSGVNIKPDSQSEVKDYESASNSDSSTDDLDKEFGGIDEELADLDNFNFDNIGADADTDVSVDSAEAEATNMDNLQDLGRSTSIIFLLQSALKDFYNNSLYEGDFVEEIVMFDCYGISSQAMDNIRSNLMIDMSFVRVNLIDEITNLIQIELNS